MSQTAVSFVTIAAATITIAAAAQAQGVPDLAVSMSANPNPVVNRAPNNGFEVLIMVQNIRPPAVLSPMGGGPTAPRAPGGPRPPPPGFPVTPTPAQGADVQQATITFGGDLVSFNPQTGFVEWKADPALNIRNCQTVDPPFGQATRCSIGPLANGGSWQISLVYRADRFTPGRVSWTTAIDDLNQITERDKSNNSTSVAVTFQ